MGTNGCKCGEEVTSHLKHDNKSREQTARLDMKGMFKNPAHTGGCVGAWRGLINLQHLMRVVIQQDVAPPSLVLADVIKMKLHSWKHLLGLLREVRKKERGYKNVQNTATQKIRRKIRSNSYLTKSNAGFFHRVRNYQKFS